MSSTPAPAPRQGLREGLRALRHREFRLWFFGQGVSMIGTWMQSVAQGWLMHRLTSAPLMLGLLSFTQFIPVLPLALHAGVIADRVPRRRLLLWTQSLQLLHLLDALRQDRLRNRLAARQRPEWLTFRPRFQARLCL